jgi:hypothetical protein
MKNTPFKVNYAISGRFGFERVRADGTVVQRGDLFDNLILNSGKDKFLTSTSGQISFAPVVGTGTATPLATDTLLTSYLAATASSTLQSAPQTKNFSVAPYYLRKTFRWRFGLGVAAGNITEFGVATDQGGFGFTPNSASVLFSKALVKDALGNPIAVTVQADEYLDVIWELTITITTSTTGTFNISLKGVVTAFDYTMAPLCGNLAGSLSGGWDMNANSTITYAPYFSFSTSASTDYSRLYSGATGVGAATDTQPPGVISPVTADNADSASRASYTTGSYYRDFTWGWSLNFGNRNAINAFKLGLGTFGTLCLYLSSGNFNKANTDTFSVTVRVTVS